MPGGLPAHAVLDELRIDRGTVRLVAWRDEHGTLLIGISGPRPFSGAIACHTGTGDEPVSWTASSTQTVSVMWGYVNENVARCEIRNRDGSVVPAKMVDLPPDLSTSDRAVWGLGAPDPWGSAIVAYDGDGRPLGRRPYPVGAAEVVVSGEDPGVGPWSVEVVPLDRGLVLEMSVGGLRAGGFGFLEPLGDRDLDGWSYAGRDRTPFTGVVSARVGSVELILDDGRTVAAALFPIPEHVIGPAQVFVVFVEGRGLAGDLVVRDRDDRELARSRFERVIEAPEDRSDVARSDGVRFDL